MISEEESFRNMSPIDQLRAPSPRVGPEEAAVNRQQNARDLLSVIPGPGNVIAAEDAVDQGGEAVGALREGRYGRAALHGGLSALSAFGAVTGFPTSRLAGNAARDASRTTNIFAGPMAKTADHAALAKAQEMKAAGASRGDIHFETGWDLGNPDGVPRFEIDDSQMSVKFPRNADSGSYHAYPTAVDHPELFDAYSPMRRDRINFDSRTENSSISTDVNPNAIGTKKYDTTIGVQGRKRWTEPAFIPSKMDKIRGDTAHEFQHNVQTREGMAPGSDPFALLGDLENTGSPEFRQLHADLWSGKYGSGDDPAFKTALARYDEMQTQQAYDQYRRTAGEVEARNVATRLNMTAAERRAKAPWFTQDVPDEQQIVRRR